DEALQQRLAARLSQVERDRAFAPSLDRPEERVAVDERPDRAHEVALARQLDLDHVGAEIAEQRRRERRRDARAEVEDPQPHERPRAHRAVRLRPRPRSRSAIMRFTEPVFLRARSASVAVFVPCMNWWTMK